MLQKYKVILYVVLLGGIILGIISYSKWRYNTAFDAGYKAATVVYQDASQKAIDLALSELRLKLGATIAQQKNELESLTMLNRQLSEQKQTEVVYRDIPKIVEKSSCKRIGLDVMGLFNRIIGENPTAEQ